MEHELMILDHTGHRSLKWDPTLEATVTEARSQFEYAKAAGYLAYTVDGANQGAVVKAFDPAAEKLILAPPMIGG